MRCKPKIGGIGYQGMSSINPGPGQYSLNQGAIKKSIAYTFGVKPVSYLDRTANQAPGPGQYNIGTLDGESKSQRASARGGSGFGTEKRAVGGLTKSALEVPGPGQYSMDKNLGGPAIGFGTSQR
jgi:Sperm-tail PG-rich repeat